MKNRILILLCSLAVTAGCVAQEAKLSFEGRVQTGILEGQQGTAFQLGIFGGVKKRTWTASVGSGIDYYGVRSIPLYLELQKRLFNKTEAPFIYAGGGHHFAWLSDKYKDARSNVEGKGGLYYQAGIGYQLPVMKKAALYFAAGYSYKEYTETITQTRFCVMWPCPQYEEKLSYRLRRLAISTGIRF
jgi:hypothetical protein